MFSKVVLRAVSRVGVHSQTQKFLTGRNFATYKTTTGLVGLAVDPESRATILALSAQVLSSVKVFYTSIVIDCSLPILFVKCDQKIPETAQYRVDVEKWFNFITKTALATEDVYYFISSSKSVITSVDLLHFSQDKQIEDEIGLGQLEEVACMAREELWLVDYYYGE